MKFKYLLASIDNARNKWQLYSALEELDYQLKINYGYVYLAHMESTPYYKIGKSARPEKRISELNGAMLPTNIVLVHAIQTDMMTTLESDLHCYFQHCHVRGEWYQLTIDEVEYLKAFGPAHYFYADLVRREFKKFMYNPHSQGILK
jgi:hypothetical protein